MKLVSIAALALIAATPAFAGTPFLVDFEKNWDYTNGDVNNYYNGGTAADGTSGANLGVSFVNISGLSNDADFTYYTNAPSMLGTAYAHTFDPTDKAFMNVASGVDNTLSFFYSSPTAVTGAVVVYSGLNGTGAVLGTFDLDANDASAAYAIWSQRTLSFNGNAKSFDFTASANVVGLDNISPVPEPESLAMLLAGLGLLGFAARRRSC